VESSFHGRHWEHLGSLLLLLRETSLSFSDVFGLWCGFLIYPGGPSIRLPVGTSSIGYPPSWIKLASTVGNNGMFSS
jgi:hypothetical protein